MSNESKVKLGRPKDPALQERRQEEILDKAAKIFGERGYPNTEVQIVADALGIGKGTIYRYFLSKEELFLAAVDRGMQRFEEEIHSKIAAYTDPLERLSKAIHLYLKFFQDYPEIVELLIQERAEFRDRKASTYFTHRDMGRCEWEELFTEMIRQGRVRKVPVSRIMDVVHDVVYGKMFANHFTGNQKPLEEQARDIIDIVFHGILTPAERKKRGELK